MNGRTIPVSALIVGTLWLSSGCAHVRFLETMEEIQRARVRLHDNVLSARPEESLASIQRLEDLFRSPAIVNGPYSNHSEFASKHDAMLEALQAIRHEARKSGGNNLPEAYGLVTGACQNCHDDLAR